MTDIPTSLPEAIPATEVPVLSPVEQRAVLGETMNVSTTARTDIAGILGPNTGPQVFGPGMYNSLAAVGTLGLVAGGLYWLYRKYLKPNISLSPSKST